jgi:hypothetical protein
MRNTRPVDGLDMARKQQSAMNVLDLVDCYSPVADQVTVFLRNVVRQGRNDFVPERITHPSLLLKRLANFRGES